MSNTVRSLVGPAAMVLVLGICAVAFAQAPPGEEASGKPDAGEQSPPCGDASGAPSASPGPSAPSDGEQGNVAGQTEVCEEQNTDADAGGEGKSDEAPAEPQSEAISGPEAAVEEDPDIQASAEDVFKPVDEISEDYAVPLPSDI